MIYNTQTYIDMVSYMRPEGSVAQKQFCQKYLEPVFGQPDQAGNYILRIGKPKVAYMSHHDTVHDKSGRQKVAIDSEFAYSVDGNCLGADCTTGIYIMLRMIQAGVEGLYIVHAAEEVGCKGSSYIATQTPEVVQGIDFAISFDRYGYNSIITHQMGMRTCSDKFADSLEFCLDLGYNCDTRGSYTDSNEYTALIPECTNISVGYFSQHTKKESQDLIFMDQVADAFINADMSSLLVDRDCTTDTPLLDDSFTDLDLEQIVAQHPKSVAKLLQSFGYSANGLREDIQEVRNYYY